MATSEKSKPLKKKDYKIVKHAIVFINATFNNTHVSITNPQGDVILWSAAGVQGFKSARKSTAYAGKVTTEEVMKNATSIGVKSVDIKISGPGSGRESALRAVAASGVRVNSITDVTSIPHNGCRPPKRRRL